MSDNGSPEANRIAAVGRWAALGPYYAMFPIDFAFEVVSTYCPAGGVVIDPFAGRASSIYAAVASQRSGIAIEINSVGWLYGKVKTGPARFEDVAERLAEVARQEHRIDLASIVQLPRFFSYCYSPRILKFLLAARLTLQWRTNIVDSTLMAIILVHLHGKRDQSFSNQMRQGKSMSPDYCVRWWQEREMTPPDFDPVEFVMRKLQWRYAKGMPALGAARVIHGDSAVELLKIKGAVSLGQHAPADLLFTSPPYYSVTNYNYDQWLRLWMLGQDPFPVRTRGPWESKFTSRSGYIDLLETVFRGCAEVLNDQANVYVRTDARPFTRDTTIESLRRAFPGKKMSIVERPLRRASQTALFGDKSQKPGDVDIILRQA